METIYDVLPIVLLILFLIFLYLLSIVYFMRRAISSILKAFREHSALGEKNARTPVELGLIQRQSFGDRLVKSPDYKPQALQFLMKLEVVKEKGDTHLYLSEENLEALLREKTMDGESAWKLWKLLLPRK